MEKQKKVFEIKLPKMLEYHPGYVYAVKVGDYIKIGRTHRPDYRLRGYSAFPPFDYELVLLERVPDCKFFERALQVPFIEFQVKGEWFDMPKYNMDYKQEIRKIFDDIFRQVKDDNIFKDYWKDLEDKFYGK